MAYAYHGYPATGLNWVGIFGDKTNNYYECVLLNWD